MTPAQLHNLALDLYDLLHARGPGRVDFADYLAWTGRDSASPEAAKRRWARLKARIRSLGEGIPLQMRRDVSGRVGLILTRELADWLAGKLPPEGEELAEEPEAFELVPEQLDLFGTA